MAIAILPPLRPIAADATAAERLIACRRAVRDLYDANPRHRAMILKRYKNLRRQSR